MKRLHILQLDIDTIRDFFKSVGYDGKNSDLFQKPASWGVQFLFDEAVKSRGLSLIVDSNLSHLQTAKENMLKLLKEDYKIEIFYIYNELEKCFLYTKKRESVTNRLVPEDVFLTRSVRAQIKKLFEHNISLHVINKRDNSYYKDVSYEKFKNIIPEYKAQK